MLFALLVLATPRIGPPPNVGPLNPEAELELGLGLELVDPDEPGLSVVASEASAEAFCVSVG